MVGVSKAVGEEVLAKVEKALKECARQGDISWKLKAILAVPAFGVSHVAALFQVSRVAVMQWIHKFTTQGVDGLKMKPGRGRKSLLTPGEQQQVQEWLGTNPNLTIQAVQATIQRTFQKKVSKSAIQPFMKRVGLAYITPRPVHHQQEPIHHEAFKKKSTTAHPN